MLSLGRSRDPDLDNMHFSSPIVETGKELFHSTEPGTGQCKGCHFNAGANSSTSLQNGNRNTGVENLPNILKLVWQEAPSDGSNSQFRISHISGIGISSPLSINSSNDCQLSKCM